MLRLKRGPNFFVSFLLALLFLAMLKVLMCSVSDNVSHTDTEAERHRVLKPKPSQKSRQDQTILARYESGHGRKTTGMFAIRNSTIKFVTTGEGHVYLFNDLGKMKRSLSMHGTPSYVHNLVHGDYYMQISSTGPWEVRVYH